MKLGHTLKAGIALAVSLTASAATQAAAVSYFGNNPTANGGVVLQDPSVALSQDPVRQRNNFLSSLASSQTEAFNMSTGAASVVSDLFAAGSGVSLEAHDLNDSTESFVEKTHGGPSAWTGRFNTTSDPASLQPSGGSGWFETNRSTVEVRFTTAVSAFGTFLTDVGDFDGALAVEIFSTGGSVFNLGLIDSGARTAQGGLAFFGYTNDTTQFNRVVFTLRQPAVPVGQFDFIGFDDFITGTLKPTLVPEPTSLALVGLSLALLGCSRRRKSKA